MDFHKFRKEYTSTPLNAKDMEKDPVRQFRKWLKEAEDQRVVELNAMVLATANAEARPSSRTVLLKEIDGSDLIFYTNYESRKARELTENPFASATFYWKEIERQVTLDGQVEKISEEHSQAYFTSRPRNTQLGAWSSKQGSVIPSRKLLEESLEHYAQKFSGIEVPKPPSWGGYRIIPNAWFFWQGRENRLHDRFLYSKKKENEWQIARLSP